jgi:hypothetical protein
VRKLQLVPHREHSKGQICALLRYNAALSGGSASNLRDNLSAPSSRIKKSKKVVIKYKGIIIFNEGMGTYCKNYKKHKTDNVLITFNIVFSGAQPRQFV